jgi:hypothetical protein
MMKQLAWSSAALEVMPSSENGVDLVLSVNLMKIFFPALSRPAWHVELIRITLMILEFCPDLSQRVNQIDKSSNNTKNVT